MPRITLLVVLFAAACDRSRTDPAPARAGMPSPTGETDLPRLSGAEPKPAPPSASPSLRRGPFVQSVGSTQATVCVETTSPIAAKLSFEGRVLEDSAKVRHLFELKELKPGQRYSYTVEPGGITGSFKTAPDPDGDLFFIAWGDSRTYYERLARISALAAKDLPDFTVHSGDLVDEGSSPEDWDHFFESAAPLLRTGALWPALGNHEAGAKLYFDLFLLPEPGNYYTFTAGPAQFFVLDSNWEFRRDARQLAWFESELKKSKSRFKFVVTHYPLVSCPDDDFIFEKQSSMYGIYGSLIEEAKVTAVFQGHNHNYQRAERKGVLYITTGGGGAPLYPVGELTSETKFAREVNHYVRVRLTGRRMALEAVDLTGQVIDQDERVVP